MAESLFDSLDELSEVPRDNCFSHLPSAALHLKIDFDQPQVPHRRQPQEASR